MEESRRLVWILLGLFTLVCAVLFWNFMFQWTSFFQSGTTPTYASKPVQPTLPPLRATDPARGSTDPKALLIVEFADFTCPYCRQAEPELQTVIRENLDSVRHVWRDLPVVTDRPDAMVAASAGRCAMDQGKFWDMHDRLISYNGTFDIPAVETIAKQIGLDTTLFHSCVSSGQHITDIQHDIDDARAHNLTGAPTIFVGGVPLEGLVTASDLRWALLKARLSL